MSTSIYNPTSNCPVDHQINAKRIVIPPGATVKVEDGDVPELLKILGFLVVGDSKDETVEVPVVQPQGEVEMVVTPTVEVKKKEAKKPKQFSCENLVTIKNINTGRKEKKQCGFKSVRKLALVSHIKNEHPKGKLLENSELALDTTEKDLRPLKEDLN